VRPGDRVFVRGGNFDGREGRVVGRNGDAVQVMDDDGNTLNVHRDYIVPTEEFEPPPITSVPIRSDRQAEPPITSVPLRPVTGFPVASRPDGLREEVPGSWWTSGAEIVPGIVAVRSPDGSQRLFVKTDELSPEQLQTLKENRPKASDDKVQVTTPEQSAAPVPEAPQTVAAQLDALTAGRRAAVVVTPGEAVPEVPDGMKSFRSKAGTVIYDPKQVNGGFLRKKIEAGADIGQYLGHVEPTPEEPTHVVVARDPESGAEIQSSYVSSPEKATEQARAFQQQHPGAEIVAGGPGLEGQVLDERLSKNGQKTGKVSAASTEEQHPGGNGVPPHARPSTIAPPAARSPEGVAENVRPARRFSNLPEGEAAEAESLAGRLRQQLEAAGGSVEERGAEGGGALITTPDGETHHTRTKAETVEKLREVTSPKPDVERDHKHKFSSTQVNIEGDARGRVLDAAARIRDADLYTEEPGYGREEHPHITVKYGLHGNSADAVREALANMKPFDVALGKTSLFEGTEGTPYDVVKVDVKSPALHKLNKLIADALPHTDTHPKYVPHVTLAYVKSGRGRKYANKSWLEGTRLRFDSVVFSDRDGNETIIPLAGGKKNDTVNAVAGGLGEGRAETGDETRNVGAQRAPSGEEAPAEQKEVATEPKTAREPDYPIAYVDVLRSPEHPANIRRADEAKATPAKSTQGPIEEKNAPPAQAAPVNEPLEKHAVWLRWPVVESHSDGRAEIVRVPDDQMLGIKTISPGDYGVVEHHPEGGHSFHGPMSLDEAREDARKIEADASREAASEAGEKSAVDTATEEEQNSLTRAGTEADAHEELAGRDGQDGAQGTRAADLPRAGESGQTRTVRRGQGRGSSPDARPNDGRGARPGGDLERTPDPYSATGKPQPTRGGNRDSAGDRVPRGNDYIAPPGSLVRAGSWRETALTNLRILELVKQLETEGRLATPEEQALLVRFTGWGATEIANNLFPGASYGHGEARRIRPEYARDGWRDLAERAARLFTPAELKTALRSTQYAHYTSEKIIRGIWSALTRFGFRGGRLLEPGMGVGLFPVAAPADLITRSRYTGVEMDSLTARIAKQVLQNQAVIEGDYVHQKLPDNFFDVVIGNPPFASTRITEDPRYRKYRFMLHDYFFAKSIDKTRPGGLLVFVTSKGTMDKGDDSMRRYIAERADLLGAIRLPQTAFKQNAGTEVVTDVLFLRKRLPEEEPKGEAWLGRADVTGRNKGGEEITGPVNEYFVNHPQMVLGEHSFTGKMRAREDEYTVTPREGDIEEHFAEAVGRLPSAVYAEQAKVAETVRAVRERDWNPATKKEGSLYVHEDGTLMRVESGSGVALSEVEKVSPSQEGWLKSYVSLRTALKQSQYDQLNEGEWEQSLAELNRAYDAFVSRHGRLLDFTLHEREERDEEGGVVKRVSRRYKNSRLLAMDVESPLVEALERINEDGEIVKGPALLRRTIKRPEPPQVRTLSDALAVSLDHVGALNLDHVARVITDAGTPMTREEVIRGLGDAIYEVPGGDWQMSDEYLSGYVVEKLAEAEAAARLDARFERNVRALSEVQPKPLTPTQINVGLGAVWVPPEVVGRFAEETLGMSPDSVSFNPLLNSWGVAGATGAGSQMRRTAAAEWGTAARSPQELLEAALNGQTVKVYRTEGSGKEKRTFLDEAASAAANDLLKKMRQAFKTWVWQDSERAADLAARYNRQFNNIAPRRFDGSHLTLPGLSAFYQLYPHQKRAVWRVLQTGNTYLAHAVGAGKTLEMIVSAMEQKRLGLINKPMFVVPGHMLKQFSSEFLEAYPMANVLVADEKNFARENRRRFVAQAALNDLDAVVIPHSAFGMIRTRPETSAVIVNDLVGQLQAAIDELDPDDRSQQRLIKRLEARIETIERRFAARTDESRTDDVINFEDMGVDFLYVDEAHEFRKLDFVTNHSDVKGITPDGSRRALDLLIKLRWLDSQRPGRSAVMASGTPVTNTLAELYSIQRFLDQRELEDSGLSHFDAWAAQFGEVVGDYEMNAAGRYEYVERFSRFINVPELMKRVRKFMDVLTLPQLSGLVDLPAIEGGKPEVVVVPATEGQREYLKELERRIEVSRQWKPSFDEPNNPDPLIAIIADARLAAIDMRFINPHAENDPGSKLNRMIDEIISAHRKYKDLEYRDRATGETEPVRGAAQIVFAVQGFGEGVISNRGFDSKKYLLRRLSEGGIRPSEVAFMDDYKQAAAREQLFKEMRQGTKKVLIGSPKNMGTGVNVQKRLRVLHFLSPPWYPADVEQPDGRIVRQGNQNPVVSLKRYATKGTYDSTGWAMIARKSRSIEQAMSGDDSVRTLEDVSESSLYEMASAMAAGDDRAIKLASLRRQIEGLTRLQNAHHDEQHRLRYERRTTEHDIQYAAEAAAKNQAAIEAVGAPYVRPDDFRITAAGRTPEKRTEMGEALLAAWAKAIREKKGEVIHGKKNVPVEIGRAMGRFPLVLTLTEGMSGIEAKLHLKVADTSTELTDGWVQEQRIGDVDAQGLATRVYNALNGFAGKKRDMDGRVAQKRRELKQIESKIGRPFAEEQELYDTVAQFSQLQAEMAGEGEASPAPDAEGAMLAAQRQTETPEFKRIASSGIDKPALSINDHPTRSTTKAGGRAVRADEADSELNHPLAEGESRPASADRIQGLEHLDHAEIESRVESHLNHLLGDDQLVDFQIVGSRTKGTATPESDLDVVLEYRGKTKEGDLFNWLNSDENRLRIDGVDVDFTPIRRQESGTLKEWLKENAAYEKPEQLRAASNRRAYEEYVRQGLGQYPTRIDELPEGHEVVPHEFMGRSEYAVRKPDGTLAGHAGTLEDARQRFIDDYNNKYEHFRALATEANLDATHSLTGEEALKADPFQLLDDMQYSQDAQGRVRLNPAAAEMLARVAEQIDLDERGTARPAQRFSGMTLYRARLEKVAGVLERAALAQPQYRKKLDGLVAALRDSRERNGAAILYVRGGTVPHEEAHRLVAVSSNFKPLIDRVDVQAGMRLPAFKKGRRFLVGKLGYPDSDALIAEEVFTHLWEGGARDLGVTRAEALQYLEWYFSSFEKKNGRIPDAEFDRLVKTREEFLPDVARGEFGRRSASLRGVQEGRSPGDEQDAGRDRAGGRGEEAGRGEGPQGAKSSRRADYERTKRRVRQRLKELLDGTTTASGLYPLHVISELLPDLARLGAFHIRNGASEFADWSKAMAEDLGEGIRPHLRKIFAEARKLVASPEELEGNEQSGRTAAVPEADSYGHGAGAQGSRNADSRAEDATPDGVRRSVQPNALESRPAPGRARVGNKSETESDRTPEPAAAADRGGRTGEQSRVEAAGSVEPTADVSGGGAGAKPPAVSPRGDEDTGGAAQKERAFPQTLESAGLEGGDDRTYSVVTNAQAEVSADRVIAEKGTDGAAEYLRSSSLTDAYTTALAVKLIARLQEEADASEGAEARRKLDLAVSVASDISSRLTRQGQAVQAARIAARLSPERVVMTAQRIVESQDPKARLTPEQVTELKEAASRTREAEARAERLSKKLRQVRAAYREATGSDELPTRPRRPRTQPRHTRRMMSLADRFARLEEEARQRMAARVAQMRERPPDDLGQIGASILPQDLADLAIIGAAKMARGVVNRGLWFDQMADEYGKEIARHLPRIRKEAGQLYRSEKAAMRREALEYSVTGGRPEDFTPEEIEELVEARRQRLRAKARDERDLAYELGAGPKWQQPAPKEGPPSFARLVAETNAVTEGRDEMVRAGALLIAQRVELDPRRYADAMRARFPANEKRIAQTFKEAYEAVAKARENLKTATAIAKVTGGRPEDYTAAEIDRMVRERRSAQGEARKGRVQLATAFRRLQKPRPEDYLTRWRRMVALSSVTTLGKLSAATAWRNLTTPMEELAGLPLSWAMPRLAAKAPREGGASLRAERDAFVQFFRRATYGDIWQKLATGQHSLDRQYGDHDLEDAGPAWWEFFGRVHGALKTEAQRAEFFRALSKRTAHALKKGLDVHDPEVQMALGTQAYLDSKRAILMSDNLATDIYQSALRRAEEWGVPGRAVATAGRLALPIVKVPTNYVFESSSYLPGVGAAKGLGRILLSKGVENMTEDEADYTLRAFKKQLVGLGLLALGFFGYAAVQAGGYYVRGEKRKAGDLQPGELKVFGVTIPHLLAHAPALEVIQWGATLRNVMTGRCGTKKGSLTEGLYQATKGLAEETPFVDAPLRAGETFRDTRSVGKAAGEFAKDVTVPPDVQRLARMRDEDSEGEPIKRKADGGVEQFESGVPGLRQSVPPVIDAPDAVRHAYEQHDIQPYRAPSRLKVAGHERELSETERQKLEQDVRRETYARVEALLNPQTPAARKNFERFQAMSEERQKEVLQSIQRESAEIVRGKFKGAAARAERQAAPRPTPASATGVQPRQ
jgi:N12 class adenine-specific DNA methylase/2'-5' RNA ligase